jgi:hypothetical protein
MLPSQVNERETLGGIFNLIEWLMVQRDNRDAEAAAQQAQREAAEKAQNMLPRAKTRLAAPRGGGRRRG